jgi:hypothetical protein
MAPVTVTAESHISAPPARVYTILSNYREHHPRILPPTFSDLTVEQGGIGAGTIINFRMKVFGRKYRLRHRIDEPEPGRVLRETDLDSGMVTTFHVAPEGDGSRLRIETVMRSRGARGLMERLFVPRMLRPLYADELARIDRYARQMIPAAV